MHPHCPPISPPPQVEQDEVVQLLHRVLGAIDDLRAVIRQTRKEFYTVDEIASLAGRTPYTIRRWIGEGRLTATRVQGTGPRGRLLVPGDQLTRLLGQGLGGELAPASMTAHGPRNETVQ